MRLTVMQAKEVFLYAPTCRLELLNACGMAGWATFLARSILANQPSGLFPTITQMIAIMPLWSWVAVLTAVASLQAAGVMYGYRIARGVAAFSAGSILFSIVWAFGVKDMRFPFVSYGFVMACGQWFALVHIIIIDRVQPLVVKRQKEILSK